MEPRCPARAGNTKTVQGRIKDITPENIGVEWRTISFAENEVLRLIVI